MPSGEFRIVGPVRTRSAPNHMGFITQKRDGRRWRQVAVTYFGGNEWPDDYATQIKSILMLRGKIEVVFLSKALN